MGEEITNTTVTETPGEQAPTEENNQQIQTPETNQETEQPQGENSNSEVQGQEQQVQQEQGEQPSPGPTLEELQAEVNQYKLREEEDRMLRERLGLGDVDQQTYNYINMDQQVVNEGKQVYLKLCNDYGINADPDKLDASVQELMKTDPAKAYEFQRKFDMLSEDVINKRQEIQTQNAVYEVNKFEQEYKPILNASPALMNIMQQYVQNYGNSGNVYAQLKGVMDIVMPAYQEAFNAGRMYGMSNKAKTDTTPVQGGVAAANSSSYQPGQVFTRDQIKRMSPEEFAKNEKFIQQQMLEGKIQ